MKLQTSPYLQWKDEMVHDVLHGRTITLGKNIISFLQVLRKPRTRSEIQGEFDISEAAIDKLLQAELLVDEKMAWKRLRLISVSIEISTHCNWRCVYCPVSVDPKPKRTMGMDLYREILKKSEAVASVQAVEFNAYNEPGLDTLFGEKVIELSKTRLKLALHSNGSVLTEEKLQLLKSTNVLSILRFNLPSYSKENFRELTGSPTYNATIKNVERAVELGLPVALAVNGTKEEIEENLPELQRRFGDAIQCNVYKTSDRAGLLDNRYKQGVHVGGPLTGCFLPLLFAYINIDGDLYICCQDYYQKEVIGNIKDGDLMELMLGDKAIEMRKKVFGEVNAEDDFICRKCSMMVPWSGSKDQDEKRAS